MPEAPSTLPSGNVQISVARGRGRMLWVWANQDVPEARRPVQRRPSSLLRSSLELSDTQVYEP